MVLGNYALLTGVSPEQLNNWFLSVYVDAYEWVELPNVSGMVLFADGGILASKPYVSGGAYIDRMSNYCGSCKYNVKKKTGENACPFNYLYWNFLMSHEDKFKNNPRMGMMYRTLSKMSDENRNQIQKASQIWLNADP
jgi:deoxyribodipyrimidine photolyase-related protein